MMSIRVSLMLGSMLLLLKMSMTTSFVAVITQPSCPAPTHKISSSCHTRLQAAAKKKTSNTKKAVSFGGAAMEPCPCGFGESYARCCGRLHTDVNAYKLATASQVVRARYSAYAKKQAEFLMASTHPFHKDFDTDLKRWKDKIKQNMYDNFDLSKCHILEESYEGDETKAAVKFVAEMMLRESGEITGFMETSQLERAKTHGGWLYLDGTMETAPEDLLVKNLDTSSSSRSTSSGSVGKKQYK